MGLNDQVTDTNGQVTQHAGSPTLGSLATNWGTPTVSSAADDLAGQVGATAGSTPPAAGTVGVVSFAGQFARPPRAVVIDGPLGTFATAVTVAGFTITTTTAPAANAVLNWYYHVDP